MQIIGRDGSFTVTEEEAFRNNLRGPRLPRPLPW